MGIQTQKVEPHWNYLFAIERDLDVLSRYVEFDEKNFLCFSIEIARILLASAAEVDVVCKQLCKEISPKSKAEKIHEYRKEITPGYTGIPQFQISLPQFGLTLTPWDEWKKRNGVPLWWRAYNNVKHHRDSHYGEANLKNALNAVAGLYVMLIYLYEAKGQVGQVIKSPQLLEVDPIYVSARSFAGTGIAYKL